ncbi:MAG: hypothetical protein NZM04_09675 [Methylacidiphilales bacterium]|nr:hypothetical protein [Candidatus Methylacidiphilales bacterium]
MACAPLSATAQHLAVSGKHLFFAQLQTLAACIAASQSLKQRWMLANGKKTKTRRKVSWAVRAVFMLEQLPTQGRAGLPEGSNVQPTVSATDNGHGGEDDHIPQRVALAEVAAEVLDLLSVLREQLDSQRGLVA